MTNSQMLLKKPILRIYPLSNDYRATALSAATHEEFPDAMKYTYSIFRKDPYSRVSVTHADGVSYKARVLPNGFYFHEIGLQPASLRNHLKLNCAVLSHIRNPYKLEIKEPLESSLSAIVVDKKNNSQLICAAKNRKRIYAFDLKTKTYHSLFDVAHPNESISSIVTFYQSKNKRIVIALNTGEIKLASIKNNHLLNIVSLENPGLERSGEFELLASQQGFLIAYNANKSLLRIWNINSYQSKDYFCSNLQKLNLSPNGKYLTALSQEQQSSVVYIYKLSPFKLTTLQFDQPITDFTIGYHDHVCFAQNNSFEHRGKIKKILEHCRQEGLSDGSSKLKVPLDALNLPAKTISTSRQGLFGRQLNEARSLRADRNVPTKDKANYKGY